MPGLSASASSLSPFPPPKHGKQLIFLFPLGLPVAATLWAPSRRRRCGRGRGRATTRRGQERRARAHGPIEPPAAVTARRPCPGVVSAPTRRLHFVERHARARRRRRAPNGPDRPARCRAAWMTSGGGLLRRSTGEGHGATTGRRSMAMAMAMAGNGMKALEIEGSKGLPRDRGIGGGHRWRGGERRGGLSLAGGVDRGALQNEGLGTCRPRMYLKRAGNGGTAARQTAHHRIVRSCRLPLHALFLPAGTLSQNHTGIQIPTFCAAKTDQIKM